MLSLISSPALPKLFNGILLFGLWSIVTLVGDFENVNDVVDLFSRADSQNGQDDGKYVERRASNPDVFVDSASSLNAICTAFEEVRPTRGMKADAISGGSVTPKVTGPRVVIRQNYSEKQRKKRILCVDIFMQVCHAVTFIGMMVSAFRV